MLDLWNQIRQSKTGWRFKEIVFLFVFRYLLSLGADTEAENDCGEKPADLIDPDCKELLELFGVGGDWTCIPCLKLKLFWLLSSFVAVATLKVWRGTATVYTVELVVETPWQCVWIQLSGPVHLGQWQRLGCELHLPPQEGTLPVETMQCSYSMLMWITHQLFCVSFFKLMHSIVKHVADQCTVVRVW